jgi:hypothetical protein
MSDVPKPRKKGKRSCNGSALHVFPFVVFGVAEHVTDNRGIGTYGVSCAFSD